MTFFNRKEAGKKLASLLEKYKGKEDVLVLGIPRGGVVVAKEVADYLQASLNVVAARKIGHPYNPEYAVGAVDLDGEVTLNEEASYDRSFDSQYINDHAKEELKTLKERVKMCRAGELKAPNVAGKMVIIVDDGIATGLTTLSVVKYLKKRSPKKIILAVPVAPPETVSDLVLQVDELEVLEQPENFYAVGQFYQEFPQVSESEIRPLLNL